MTITYRYDRPLSNKYNITTPQLAFGMAYGENPIMFIMSQLGYTGNTSTSLPTYMGYTAEDEDGADSGDCTIDYTFAPDGAIQTITASGMMAGPVGRFSYTYHRPE